LGVVARENGMLAEMSDACLLIYPGIAALIGRMLPTYVPHAARRATEMSELEATAHAAGVEGGVIDAIRHWHDETAAIAFENDPAPTVASIIERLATKESSAISASPR
jgi:hypothetical protein